MMMSDKRKIIEDTSEVPKKQKQTPTTKAKTLSPPTTEFTTHSNEELQLICVIIHQYIPTNGPDNLGDGLFYRITISRMLAKQGYFDPKL